MRLKSFKIYVAGHNGMVGKALIKNLKKNGFKKIIYSNRKNLNLLNEKEVFKFVKLKKPDVIINCAGLVGGILANSTYPTQFLNENIQIQLNLINCSYKNKIKHFINLGSSCIYPKDSKQPIKENYLLSGELENTNEAYAIAKIVGLKACQFYNEQYNTKYFTLMPCNLYGPNDNFDKNNSHFIPALIRKFIVASKTKNSAVEIWGSGRPKREIMHVDDLASAIFFIMKKKITKDKDLQKFLETKCVINVGFGREFTIKKFAQLISKIISKKIKLKFNKKYPDGTKRKILNNAILKKMGWKPKISVEEGLRETINWYKNSIN